MVLVRDLTNHSLAPHNTLSKQISSMNLSDQFLPEDLEKMKELFDMPVDFPLTDQSIGELCGAHQDLADCLREFDRASAICLISALETIPNLHGNTLRIEVLLHIATSRCEGSKKAVPDDLSRWIASMDESPMGPLEDPTEDVFLGYVCTGQGGFRVYQGIFSNADFILERLVHFLGGGKTNVPGFGPTFDSVIELLRVSDAIAEELGQARYSGGEIPEGDDIPVPSENTLNIHSAAVFFDASRISRLGIDQSKLEQFNLTPERLADFDSKSLNGSPLEQHPLIFTDDGFIVASPSSLCRAATMRALQATTVAGGWANTLFGVESSHFFINEIIPRLGIKPTRKVKLPAARKGIPALFPMVGQFDYGMPVLALTMSSPVNSEFSLEEEETFTAEQIDDFTQYVADCCRACELIEGFNGGMVLIGLSNVGRPLFVALKELRPNWHFFASSLADWQTLASDCDFNAKRLWYLGLQQTLAEKSNLRIVNTAGLLNLYGFWKRNDFAFVHQSFDPRNPNNMLAISGSYSLGLNLELKSVSDRHCRRPPNEAASVILERQGKGLNPDVARNLMYVDHARANTGVLRGCVEFGQSVWWVEASARPTNAPSRSLLYRLWDCVFNWTEHTLPVVHAAFSSSIFKDLRIELEFPGIDDWRIDELSRSNHDQVKIVSAANPAQSTIQLKFSEEFLTKFYRADNLAEREIVSALINSAAEIAQHTISESEFQQLVDRVTKNKDTRFFHIVRSSSLESAIGGPHNAEPTFVPLEEIARIRTGLAYRVTENPPNQINNPKEAQVFLDKAVASIQASLCGYLKRYDILPVVSHSFSQLDELSRYGSQWGLSTRSLLALAENATWLQDRLRVESGRLALAEITNRTLIETAVYSNDPKVKEHISQTEHASLLAQLAVMIELANHRDAIAGGFVGADLKIHPNGMIDYDETFQRQIFQPYLTTRVDDRIRWNAESYDNNFESPDEPVASENKTTAVVAFKRAFQTEYGFPYDTLEKIIAYFDNQAVSQGRAGGTLDSRSLRFLLTHQVGLTSAQADGFVERFTLPTRPAWNRNLPKGCEAADVLPWRYFRGLSLLLRPFVEISRSPRTFAISAPHLHRWKYYLTNSILSGHLPDKLFHSQAMKSYLGNLANKRGHDFNEEVAAEIESLFPAQRVEIKLTELGAPTSPDLGDIDVLAWEASSGVIVLIECKRLKTALTVRQVIQQLEEFRGNREEEDSLAKHQRRIEWLKKNPEPISQLTGIASTRILWAPLLVTSGRVPMSFVDAIDFSKDQVIAEQDLRSYLTDLLAKANQHSF